MKRDRGQSLVEFALILVPLFTLLMLLVEGALYMFAHDTVTNAARTGARVAIVNQSAGATAGCDPADAGNWSIVGCAVQAASSINLPAAGVTVEYVGCADGISVGCKVRVTVSYDYQPITPLISEIPIPISASSEMQIERVYP